MKKTGFILTALMLVAGLIFAAGCIGSASQETPEGNWILNTIGSNESIGTVTLDIIDSSASGNAGINSYRGSVTFDQTVGSISFGPMISTKMGGPENLMTQEYEYLEILSYAAGYKLEDGKLIITDSEGNVMLIFGKAPAESVTGTSWTSSDYPGVTIEFGTDDRFSGKAPVNNYFGSYIITGENGLAFSQVASTEMAALNENLMHDETSFFAKLGNVAGFAISGDVLTLTDKDGSILLTFEKADAETSIPPPLVIEPPTIENIAGLWLLEGNDKVTLNLTLDGSFSGKAPVNNYFGSFEVVGSSITFSNVGATLMAALDENLMHDETLFFEALSEVTNFKLENGKLIFLNADEKVVLIFVSE